MADSAPTERLAVDRDRNTGLPVNWRSSGESEDDHRPAYTRDSDRLIDTSGFRRLQGKTQVVSPGQGDFFRTRLTHTIEVSRLARSIGFKLCRSSDEASAVDTALAAEAAGLAHDFGHPPFAHCGERALDNALREIAYEWGVDYYTFGGFEGNAQTFRQLVWAFSRSLDEPGLHLTRRTLDSVLKYPWTRAPRGMPKDKKWGYYPQEEWAFEWVRPDVPADRLIKASFEAQLMDWADDIAYATHDLEDWFRAGFIPLTMLTRVPDARTGLAVELAKRSNGSCDQVTYAARLEELFSPGSFFKPFTALTTEYDSSSEAKNAIRATRRNLFEFFIDKSAASGDLKRGRHWADLSTSKDVTDLAKIIHDITNFYVISSPSMATYEHGQGHIVEFLAKTYASLVDQKDEESTRTLPVGDREQIARLRQSADALARKGEIIRMIADYVAGMTDSYAEKMYGRLNGFASPYQIYM